ncbi:putative lipoprotein [Stachybotrys elegans]|uniref:Lipoprotein n=1 Tax=Stachybotrys elegans TaxID=80388 RepID=A0A8K0WNK3_9HYPO|nr:putative lipoprotein [Stachybotrys elegans]
MKTAAVLAVACLLASQAVAKSPSYHRLPPLREQARLQNEWVAERTAAIPDLLYKHNVDAWLISQREYAEETIFWVLKSAETFSARRRTTYLYMANTTHGGPAAYSWIDNTPQIWDDILEVLERHEPATIAVNDHQELAFASGLHAGERDIIAAELGSRWTDRFVLRPLLSLDLIGTQIAARLDWYRKLQETAWAMISKAFSAEVITAGETTPADVEWWLREELQAHNLTTWFPPSVSILVDERFPGPDRAIAPGDMLHVDFGVTAMGMNTDTQHLAYVLRPGESEAPRGLREGLRKANRMQDISREMMRPGRTGNEILKDTLAQMDKEGIAGKVYSHAVGDWGHAAGAVVGMTNLQDHVPVLGDLPLLSDTWYSVELYAEHAVPEFGGATVPFALEEDVYWDASTQTFEWLYARQDEFHLITTSHLSSEEL